MGKITGFMEYSRAMPKKRPVAERLRDWKEYDRNFPSAELRTQAARCMDCGIPFCHQGCPLGNIIPEWNDLVYRDHWKAALDRLHSTNNFPEFTGRICPAPCEEACVVNINDDPVTIKQIERQIIDRGFEEGWVVPQPAETTTGKKVAVVGSGPAGMAAAQQLGRAGHAVVLFERDDRIGGLLRYGIPEFKMEKHLIDRRMRQMEAEGVEFRPGVDVGTDVTLEDLEREFDAVCIATGATESRELPIPGRELGGIHLAMEYLPQQNRVCEGDEVEGQIRADGRKVVILGGGDTGADCLGTANRQGAEVVHQLELLPKPPEHRTEDMPWPRWPMILRTAGAHEEGVERDWSILTKSFEGRNGRVERLNAVRLEWEKDASGRPRMKEIPGSEFEIEADLVLLALGFTGPERPLLDHLGVELTDRGNVAVDRRYATSVDGVFACGDARRGQSLVVWAIWEGRECARHVDAYLQGDTKLEDTPLYQDPRQQGNFPSRPEPEA